MKTERMNYYTIPDRGFVAKGIYFDNWIYDYDSLEWKKDDKYIISDALMGYDPGEPDGSPYGIGSTSAMDEIEHIDYETAMEIIGDTTVKNLLKKWKSSFAKAKAKWDENPKRTAKKVETVFCLYGSRYSIGPKDLGLKATPEHKGFMHSIQKKMEKELIEIGATDIQHTCILK